MPSNWGFDPGLHHELWWDSLKNRLSDDVLARPLDPWWRLPTPNISIPPASSLA